jgi:hypothetical protein
MRFRATMLVVGLIALVTLGVVGCSDDSPTTPSDPGITSTQYPVVKAEVTTSLDTTVEVIQKGIELASDINTGGVGDLDDILLNPSFVDSLISQNTWHVLYGSDISAGVSTTIIDSVQYARDGVPQVDAQNANTITLRHTLTTTNENTAGSYRNIESSTNLVFTGFDGDAAVVNGTYSLILTAQVVSGSDVIVRDYVVEGTLTDVTISRSAGWSEGCPTSGTVSLALAMTYIINDGAAVETNWEFDADFENGVAQVSATLGDETASYKKSICQM